MVRGERLRVQGRDRQAATPAVGDREAQAQAQARGVARRRAAIPGAKAMTDQPPSEKRGPFAEVEGSVPSSWYLDAKAEIDRLRAENEDHKAQIQALQAEVIRLETEAHEKTEPSEEQEQLRTYLSVQAPGYLPVFDRLRVECARANEEIRLREESQIPQIP